MYVMLLELDKGKSCGVDSVIHMEERVYESGKSNKTNLLSICEGENVWSVYVQLSCMFSIRCKWPDNSGQRHILVSQWRWCLFDRML